MDKQYLHFPNQPSLDKYLSTINNFHKGEIVYLIDEEKFEMYDGEKFIDVPEKVQMIGDGLSMSVYELNKTIMSQLPVKETYADLSEERNLINDFHKKNGCRFYMLLCKDISYYTIFENENTKVCDFGTLGHAALECAQDIGKIISADLTEDQDAVEIWVRTPEADNLCMYLFNCEGLIVSFGR